MAGFRTSAGEWVRVVSGASVFDAASQASAFFVSGGRYGPQPRAETVLEVAAVGGGRVLPRGLRAGDGVAQPQLLRLLNSALDYMRTGVLPSG